MEEQFIQFIQQNPSFAYWGVLGMLLMCGLGLPLPEDITLVAGGYTVYLAGANNLSGPELLPMIIVGLVGVLSGDTALFFLGRWIGPRAFEIKPFKWVMSKARQKKVRRFFGRYGIWTAFFCRFAAGLRAPAFLLAGSAGMRFRVFFLADGAAALISVPLLVWLAWRFGDKINRVKIWLVQSKYAVAGLLVAVALYCLAKFLIRRWWREKPGEENE
ncbi:MAG: DedA family protein [Pseudomonadota bacterium]